MKSITPSLSSSAGYLIDIREQIMHALTTFINTPANTSELWESLSLSEITATYGNSREGCAIQIHSVLQDYFKNKFKDCSIMVSCSSSDYIQGVPDGRFTVHIEITITNIEKNYPIPAVISSILHVDRSSGKLLLDWNTQESDGLVYKV